jgi:hypothetical protein
MTHQRRVLTIDIGSKQAKVDMVADSSDEEEEEEEPMELPDSSTRTFAKNPLLKGIQGPQFRGASVDKQKAVKQVQQGRKSRIQFDGDEGLRSDD